MNVRARICKMRGIWEAELYAVETGAPFHRFTSPSWEYVLYRANRLVTDARQLHLKDNS